MLKFLLILLFITVGICLGDDLNIKKALTKVTVVDDIEEFKKENPDIKLTKLDRTISNSTGRFVIIYTNGKRTPGDRLVTSRRDNYNWAYPQNFRLELKYPISENGAFITFTKVTVDQSNDHGGSYIAEGGIGQNRITIIVEAYSVNHFKYYAEIYGI